MKLVFSPPMWAPVWLPTLLLSALYTQLVPVHCAPPSASLSASLSAPVSTPISIPASALLTKLTARPNTPNPTRNLSSILRRVLRSPKIEPRSITALRQVLPSPKIEPRSITAFVTDPALLVTILHSLEVAYWTLPFGFILTPIINLFRMPNRRKDKVILGDSDQTKQFFQTFVKAIDKIEQLNKQKRSKQDSATDK